MSTANVRPYLLFTATLFGLMTLGQLIRASAAVPILVGSFSLPVFASWIAMTLFGSLCIWALLLARKLG